VSTPLDPIDLTHERAIESRQYLREQFQHMRDEIARWEPRPCPADWRPQ
jgi:hypothetical protein